MVFLDLDFTENLKLGSPSALSADHGELIPSQMNALAMDIDQDTHRHHGGHALADLLRRPGRLGLCGQGIDSGPRGAQIGLGQVGALQVRAGQVQAHQTGAAGVHGGEAETLERVAQHAQVGALERRRRALTAAEISRGASAHDIFGTAVIVAAQAVDKSYLFPKLKDGPAA